MGSAIQTRSPFYVHGKELQQELGGLFLGFWGTIQQILHPCMPL